MLSDPDIISPAAMAFDGNGRLYVAELRSYMLDVDAGRQHEPTSRISMHESTKGDGMFDRHTVFADNLLFPRMMLPLDKGILTNETHSDDVLLLTDTNGDGVADKKQVFYTGVGIGPQRQRAAGAERLRLGRSTTGSTAPTTRSASAGRRAASSASRPAPPGAEWGMSMDDDGKIWLVNAAGERGPANFQIPIQYGAFMVTDQWEPDFEIPWPAPSVGDMQGGLPRVRMPADNLSHFTSTTGPEIVRSDRYPADMNGDLLFADPVGRFVRRAKIVKTEGLTQVRNAYPGSEFIISTDPLFRPVNIKQGPDGAHLHPRHVPRHHPGRELDRPRHVPSLQDSAVPAGQGDQPRPHLAAAVRRRSGRRGRGRRTPRRSRPCPRFALEHDVAAHERRDAGAARRAPDESERLVARHGAAAARAEAGQVGRAGAAADGASSSTASSGASTRCGRSKGSGALDAALVREQMKDPNPRMRIQAIRASETLYKAGNRTFDADYRALAKDADTDVAIQAMLTLSLLQGARSRRRREGHAGGQQGARREGDRRLPPAPPAPPSLAARR